MLEQGESVLEQAPPTEVERSLLCGTCGYELKGLARSGRCPECGALISASLHAYSLRSASPVYLAQLARGIVVIEVAGALRLVSASGMTFFGGFFLGGKQRELLGELASMAVAVCFAVGWWWFTSPDLRRTVPEDRLSPRRMARVSACALCLAWWLWDTMHIVKLQGIAAPSFLVGVSPLVWLIAIAAQFFQAMDYFALLARKGENARLHKRVSTFRWLIPIGVLCGFVPAMGMYIVLLETTRRMITDEQRRRVAGISAFRP